MHAAGFARLRVDRDFANHCIGAQRQVAGIRGRVDQAGGRVECGMNVAAAFAFTGAASKATAAILVVLQSVGGDARAVLGQDPAHFLHALLEGDLGAVQFGGALKYAVGKIRKVFLHPGDAEVQIHLVVVRSQIAVADGPIFSVPIAALGLEIVIGKPQRQTSPDVCLATQAARPDPGVVGAGEGILALIHNDVLDVVSAAYIAVKMLGLFKARTVRRIADGVLVKRKRMAVGRERSPIGIVVGPLHRPQFFLDGEFLSRLEHQDLQTVAGQDMRRHAASGA